MSQADIQKISQVTGLDAKTSHQLLQASGGKVEAAIEAYYGRGANNPGFRSSQIPVAVAIPSGAPVHHHRPPPPQKKSCFCALVSSLVTLAILAGVVAAIYIFVIKPSGLLDFFFGSSSFLTKPPTRTPSFSPTCGGCTREPTFQPTVRPTQSAATAFNIDLVFVTTGLSSQVQQLFFDAKAKWEQVIVADTVPIAFNILANDDDCENPESAIGIDDMVIFITVKPIDGTNGVLGRAGPCKFSAGPRARAGIMEFDSADIESLIEKGTANAVILHEMGHVFGIGTMWDLRTLIIEGEGDTLLYDGANGNQGNVNIGLSGKAIVEEEFGPGTARGHWKEDVYENELMTGFISQSIAPMSELTVRSLIDLGFTVDVGESDFFQKITPAPAGGRRLRRSVQNKTPYGFDLIIPKKISYIEQYPRHLKSEHIRKHAPSGNR